MDNGDQLKDAFWSVSKDAGITGEQFEQVVFVFAKDRLENWIDFLRGGETDESKEGPRLKQGRHVAEAAKGLAKKCLAGAPIPKIPPSLAWSCQNWRTLVDRTRI
ncbi:MAG: hypothetical protein K9N23_03450 [Akkermansiaceae bacterium]|nr:hypothetical protein [Akkermansiaceae bacterium]MCF7730712.1 hypothetical protein [Akkermansiaceae bacterium]